MGREQEPQQPKRFIGQVDYTVSANGTCVFRDGDFYAQTRAEAEQRTDTHVRAVLNGLFGLHECKVSTTITDAEETGE